MTRFDAHGVRGLTKNDKKCAFSTDAAKKIFSIKRMENLPDETETIRLPSDVIAEAMEIYAMFDEVRTSLVPE